MSRISLPLDHLNEVEKARFKSLTTAPDMAWPTVWLCVLLVVSFAASYWFCGTGQLPVWIGTLVNTTVGYVAFSVAHDSIHRSISRNAKFNDRVGQIGLLLVLPYVDVRMFRWAHILHHRFASGPRDPDSVLRGAWWSLPFRWMAIDLVYFIHALRHGDKVSAPFLKQSLINFTVVMLVVAVASSAGYGLLVLMLWFIPSRLILLILGFSFFWLPHVPHDVTQEENFTRATTIRQGHEWILGPLLQFQNYHLIHHLYPTTPFYNNYKVWQMIEPALRRKDLAVQYGLDIYPRIHLAPDTGSTSEP